MERENKALEVANKLVRSRNLTEGGGIVIASQAAGSRQKTDGRITQSMAGENAGSGEATGAAASGAQQRQSQLEQSLAGQGILGLLTGKGRTQNEQTVQDVLAFGGAADRDFKKIFNDIDRLNTSGAAAKGSGSGGQPGGTGTSKRSAARGGRATESGSISTSVSALGEAGGSTPERTTDLLVSSLSPLTESGPGGGGSALATGARDVNKVNSIVNAHSNAIQYCYERELKRNPDLKGKIVIRFTITPDGKVKEPTIISSTLGSESVERCVLSRISRWDDFGAINPSFGNATFRQVYTFGF